MGGWTLFAVISGYFALPVLGSANPVWLAIGGVSLAVFAYSLFELVTHTAARRGRTRLSAYVFGGFALLVLPAVFYHAILTATARERMCWDLQQTMIAGFAPGTRGKPGQADPKDQFQAFQCRWAPQSNELHRL